KIDMPHFRIQLERELKTRLLVLRRKYLACGGKTVALAGLTVASSSTFLVLMRAALRLYNESPPTDKAQALEELNKHIPFDRQPFSAVLELKKRKEKLAAGQIESLFSQYLTSIETVVAA